MHSRILRVAAVQMTRAKTLLRLELYLNRPSYDAFLHSSQYLEAIVPTYPYHGRRVITAPLHWWLASLATPASLQPAHSQTRIDLIIKSVAAT